MSVTELLAAVNQGDRHAAERLLEEIYGELRRLASRKLARERPGHTLQATALVHEAYLRLLGDQNASWHSRNHFFSAAAEAMRRILVEAARRKARLKHGGGREKLELREDDAIMAAPTIDLIALDEALEKLAREDPIKSKLVQLRFFTGLSVVEAGNLLGISRATADRYWAYARAWLYHEISREERE